jgi:predicted PurR-regulated permease PerM
MDDLTQSGFRLIGNVLGVEEAFNERKKSAFQGTRARYILIIMQIAPLSSIVGRTCGLISFALIVGTLFLLREIFIPLALAILLSFLLVPVATRLERWGFSRALAVICSVLIAGLVVGAIGYTFTGQLADLAGKLPQYRATISKKLEAIRHSEIGPFSRAKETISDLLEELEKPKNAPVSSPVLSRPSLVVERPANTFDFVKNLLGGVISTAGTGAIVFICVLFFLIDRDDIRDRLIVLTGRERIHTTTQALNDAGRRVSRYLLMQLIVNVSYGIPIAAGLFFIGVPNAALWGLLCAILRFIPYLGPILGAALPLVISFAVFEGWTPPLLTLGLFLVMELVSNNLIEPWLYASSTGLSKTAIVVSAIFWAWLWGGIGLLLATPLTVCLAVLGKYIPQLGFLDVLLGARSAMTPPDQFYQRLIAFREEEAGKVAREFLKTHRFAELFDELMIPALVHIKQGWHEGVLDERHFEFACDTIDELVTDVAEATGSAAEVKNAPCSVVFVPASDAADETVARMVASILRADGFRSETLSSENLAGEVVANIVDYPCNQICISATPPLAQKHARYLVKRLAAAVPNIPVLVGIWGASESRVKRLEAATSVAVVTSAQGAIAEIKERLAFPLHEKAPDSSLIKAPDSPLIPMAEN